MPTFQIATDEQLNEFLQLMHAETYAYLAEALTHLQMTWEQYSQLFKTRGQVYAIYQDERCAGFCWIESRDQVLHLHGLILNGEFKGHGLGKQVLEWLVEQAQPPICAIELGVHQSNQMALKLYENFGFKPVNDIPELGFVVLQRTC